MTDAQAQVFGWAALDHVFGFDVAFPLFTVRCGASVGAAAVDVTSHEAQAWHAEGGHVQVVASLPGFLVFSVEVGTGDGVGQENRAAAVYAVTVVAVTANFLVGEGKGVSAEGIGALQAVGTVIQLGGAVFFCALQAGAVALVL